MKKASSRKKPAAAEHAKESLKNRPLSLHPLDFDKAVEGLLNTKPKKKRPPKK